MWQAERLLYNRLVRILIAPDKFKGSLSAREVADNIAAGLRDVLPDVRIDTAPMADGGEGTAEVILEALGGRWVTTRAQDPLGREVEIRYGFIAESKRAVIEMSEAAGLRRLRESERDPLRASTFGVGGMVLDAAQRAADEIVVGLGGSGTNDGGFGMARALGFRFLTENGEELTGAVSELEKLSHIRKPEDLQLPKIIAAADVRNPLLGKNGATHVFGDQKGATAEDLELLERALARLAEVVARDLHVDFRDESGAGAAGGLGFGLMSFCNAMMRAGFDVVAEAVGLESKMKEADVVITGEGSLDRQTLEGKTPAGVARLARKLGKRVYTIVGRASDDREVRALFDGVYELGGSIPEAAELLREKARELAEEL
jgi:glycerate kinase